MKRYRRRGARVKNDIDTVKTITARLDHELCRDNPDNWHQSADGKIWCIHGNVSTPKWFPDRTFFRHEKIEDPQP